MKCRQSFCQLCFKKERKKERKKKTSLCLFRWYLWRFTCITAFYLMSSTLISFDLHYYVKFVRCRLELRKVVPARSLPPCSFCRRAKLRSPLKSQNAAVGYRKWHVCAAPIATGQKWTRMRRRSIQVVPDDTCMTSVNCFINVVIVANYNKRRQSAPTLLRLCSWVRGCQDV